MSLILAVNAGSSSLKFQILDMPAERLVTKGSFDRIGLSHSIFVIDVGGERIQEIQSVPNHEIAVRRLLRRLISCHIIQSLDRIKGVGHRVVHGGESFSDSVLVTDDVIDKIEKLADLAPLHNPANLIGIKAFRKVLPKVPEVAVFDTAFHQSMGKETYLYSLPYKYYQDLAVRKYGFHGTSHKYVAACTAQLLKRPLETLKLISCHLGGGASITAIKGGKSVDTSMGFTPLAGLTMGTRSGDIDPALIPYIMDKTDMNASEVVNILNKKSGLLGISGISSDLRDIKEAAEHGNERAKLAIRMFVQHIQKYIGAYTVKMSGLDAIIFTAGIGEQSSLIRREILHGLEFMGVFCDEEANQLNGQEAVISKVNSPIKALVIPTNEELMIARDVFRLAAVQLRETIGVTHAHAPL